MISTVRIKVSTMVLLQISQSLLQHLERRRCMTGPFWQAAGAFHHLTPSFRRMVQAFRQVPG
jgi:hypothetical protein